MLPAVIELRSLGPDDWPVWRELRLAALAEAPEAFGARLADWQGAGDHAERWRARLDIPGSYNVVVLLDGRPAGMASGVPADQPDAVELISMWVAPHARGRGVGDRLIRAVADWARHTGAARLLLAVAEGNPHAVDLYLRHGFRDLGAEPRLMPDGVRRERLMGKPLREPTTDRA